MHHEAIDMLLCTSKLASGSGSRVRCSEFVLMWGAMLLWIRHLHSVGVLELPCAAALAAWYNRGPAGGLRLACHLPVGPHKGAKRGLTSVEYDVMGAVPCIRINISSKCASMSALSGPLHVPVSPPMSSTTTLSFTLSAIVSSCQQLPAAFQRPSATLSATISYCQQLPAAFQRLSASLSDHFRR